jgi:hypothetical protein
MDIINEAIADAKRLKEVAYENAKASIAETFQPRIQRIISSKISEEEMEDEDEFEEMPADPAAPEMMADPAAPEVAPAVEPVAPVADVPPVDPVAPVAPVAPIPDDGLEAEDDDDMTEEFQRIVRELEGADDEELNLESLNDDVVLEIDDLELDDLESEEPVVETASDLRNENRRLKKKVSELSEVVNTLKSAMNEVQLLNTKLHYVSKVNRSFDLSETEQLKMLETFDRANTAREVKLVYSAIHEAYASKRTEAKKSPSVTRSLKPISSKTVSAVNKPSAAISENKSMQTRLQQLAGIKPLND